jgi:hypothetical protein
VVRDPRVAVSDKDLKCQYQFAIAVQDEIEVAIALRTKLEKRLKNEKDASVKRRIQQLLGGGGSGTPDQGGIAATDEGSLRTIIDGLNGVLGAVESASAKPTKNAVDAYHDLSSRVKHLQLAWK